MRAQFLSDLVVRELSDERWVVVAPLRVLLDPPVEGVRIIEVPAGFVTDFASVPRLPLAYWIAGGKAEKPAVVHDYLYRTAAISRPAADAVFLACMEAGGVAWWRRRMMYRAVRLFGGGSYPDRSAQ